MGLGLLRLLLAVFVAYSHFPGSVLAPNLAVSAVVAFYFISGYLMRLSYERFAIKANPVRSFYIDRFIRIYPTFLIVFVVTLVMAKTDYISAPSIDELRIRQILLELTIIPQNYAMVSWDLSFAIVPLAWSLGVEIQWYLLVPFVFLLPARIRWPLTIAMLALQFLVFMPSLTGIGGTTCDYFDADWLRCNALSDLLGYRLLFFVGAVFLLGDLVASNRQRPGVNQYLLIAITLAYGYLYFVHLADSGDVLTSTLAIEVSLAMIVFVPLSYFCLRSMQTRRENPIDWLLGKLAYPVFLAHFLARWIVDAQVGNFTYDPPRSNIAEYFYWTMILALGLAIIQAVVDHYRYKIRGFQRLSSAEPPSDAPAIRGE
jgi:peptidoglycan/LPS O-acetylase OafA/YrhL